MEYLQLLLIIGVSFIMFKQAHEKSKLENQIQDIEGKLDGIEKLLIELQPKRALKIPVRLSKDIVKEVLADIDVEELNKLKETE